MKEWDSLENCYSSIGYITFYKPNYEDELEDVVRKFNFNRPETPLEILALQYENILGESDEDDDDEDDRYLIGLNSNSFTNGYNHNIFMEWDKDKMVPMLGELKNLGGTIVETTNGYHLLKEANLDWRKLREMQTSWNCCPGFNAYSNMRKHSCLRVTPKVDNHLRILQKESSFLGDIYEQLVNKLEGVYNGLAEQKGHTTFA